MNTSNPSPIPSPQATPETLVADALQRHPDPKQPLVIPIPKDAPADLVAAVSARAWQAGRTAVVLQREGAAKAQGQIYAATLVQEERPQELECDVVRFQNNRDKWVAFVGLLDGRPYEIFTGLQDDEEGILLPKTVTKGKIIRQTNADGSHRYDFQFENKRGYKTTVEGLSGKFNPEYWNYAKLISGVLRYGMPIDHVIKLVSSLQLNDESINTWKTGVVRALKKYATDETKTAGQQS